MNGSLTAIDYVVLGVYLAVTLAIGLRVARGMHTGREYFLAGRSLPWWAVGFSLVATDIGGTDIVGVGGAAYSHGMAVANFEWIGCVPAMLLAAFIFVPVFYRAGVYTIPEYMERRFHAGVRVALAACWLIFMACNLGIMLYASGVMMHGIFGWDPRWCVLITAFLVGFYTLAGGMAAVVYTDVLQCVVMIGGCLLVTVFGLVELGGLDGLTERLEAREAAAHVDLLLPVDTPTPFPWPGVFFGLALVLGPAYWIGNQAIVQRSLGARSEREATASYVSGAVLKNVIPLVVAVPGLVAFALYPDLEKGDAAFPELVSRLMPAGLRGLFFAAFIAALMSSVDSYLNAAAAIVSKDFYARFWRKETTDQALLAVGRTATFGLLVWAVGFALVLERLEGGGIYAVFQTLMAFFQGPALALLITGLLWPRANGTGAMTGFLGGVLCAVGLFTLSSETVSKALGWEPLFRIADPFLYFSVWAFLTALVLMVVVSLATAPAPEEKTRGLVFRRRGGAGKEGEPA